MVVEFCKCWFGYVVEYFYRSCGGVDEFMFLGICCVVWSSVVFGVDCFNGGCLCGFFSVVCGSFVWIGVDFWSWYGCVWYEDECGCE